MCRAHATVRGLLGEIVGGAQDVAVADLEAGLESFSRGTPRSADVVLTVLEPYYRSLETGARVADLARELGVQRVQAIANKVRSPADAESIASFCKSRGLELLGTVPHDEAILDADREGKALLDRAPASAAVRAIQDIAFRLLE